MGGPVRARAGRVGPVRGRRARPGRSSDGPNAPGGPGQPSLGGDPHQGQVISPDALPAPRKDVPQTGLGGAAPFSLFRVPEPVTAADTDYVVNDVVRKVNFLSHARDNFDALDAQHAGYLTLAALPQSPVEKLLGRSRHTS